MGPLPKNDDDDSDRSHETEDSGSDRMVSQGNSFPFQATIEIVKGAQLLYKITQPLLKTIAAARIDTYAFTMCLRIGQALNWSEKGRARFEKDQGDQGIVSAWGKILQFGFDWKGSMREILALDEGQRFAALTACLLEMYTANIVAQVYIRLVGVFSERLKGETHWQDIRIPALSQMRSVVERFGGQLSASPFAILVEDFMSMDNHASVTGATSPRTNSRRPTSRSIATPDSIAEALYELLQLSRDGSKTQQIQLVGGADAIALAAIGVYLLELPTTLYEEVDGAVREVRRPEFMSAEKPRVAVCFPERNQKLPQTKILEARVVYLPQINDVVKDKKPNPERVLAGRCRWSEVLFKTFRGSFDRLMNSVHDQFATSLGCAARVFQAIAEGDQSLHQPWLINCRTYADSSYGPNFVDFALDRFPELGKRLRKDEGNIHASARLTYSEAEQQLERSLSAISEICHCKVCWMSEDLGPRNNTSESDKHPASKDVYCLTALATTIIRLVRVLSHIDLIDDKLCLKREGVEWFFGKQKSRHQRQRQMGKTHNRKQDERYVTRLLDYIGNDKTAPEFSHLTVAIALFSGTQIKEDLYPYTSAIQSRGICAYLRILQHLSRDAREVARICVIPGQIISQETVYDGIQDLGFNPFQSTCNFYKTEVRPTFCVPEDTQNLLARCTLRSLKALRLNVRERLETSDYVSILEASFSLSDAEGKLLEMLGPAKTVENLVRGTGLTSCDPSRHGELDSVEKALKSSLPSGYPTGVPFEILKLDRCEVFIFPADTPSALIAACGCWLPLFLTESNCLKCAIHTGFGKWKNFAVVCSEKSLADSSSRRLLEASSEVAP